MATHRFPIRTAVFHFNGSEWFQLRLFSKQTEFELDSKVSHHYHKLKAFRLMLTTNLNLSERNNAAEIIELGRRRQFPIRYCEKMNVESAIQALFCLGGRKPIGRGSSTYFARVNSYSIRRSGHLSVSRETLGDANFFVIVTTSKSCRHFFAQSM